MHVRNGRKKMDGAHLVGDVWAGLGNVAACFGEDALVVVAVEESIFHLALCAAALGLAGPAGNAVGLETGLLEDDKKTAVGGRDARAGDVGLHGEHGWVRWWRGESRFGFHLGVSNGEAACGAVGKWEALLEDGNAL
jgi:hypothetical protein